MAEERNSATVHENAIRRVLEAEKEAARIIKEVREGAAKKEESIQNPILSQGKNEEGNWFQSLVTAISERKKRKGPIEYDKEKYSLRKKIENIFARLNKNKHLAMRYKKSDLLFLTFIDLATIKMNLC